MLFRRQHRTNIAQGLRIIGSVTSEGLVEVNGHIEGKLHCGSLVISHKASVQGELKADRIVVDGRVEGPIRGGDVVLKSHAHVVGDIEHRTLAVERGAYFDGRSVHPPQTDGQKQIENPIARLRKEVPSDGSSAVSAA